MCIKCSDNMEYLLEDEKLTSWGKINKLGNNWKMLGIRRY